MSRKDKFIAFFIAFLFSSGIGVSCEYFFSVHNPFIVGGLQGLAFVVVFAIYEHCRKKSKANN